jgi:hypothetical protein
MPPGKKKLLATSKTTEEEESRYNITEENLNDYTYNSSRSLDDSKSGIESENNGYSLTGDEVKFTFKLGDRLKPAGLGFNDWRYAAVWTVFYDPKTLASEDRKSYVFGYGYSVEYLFKTKGKHTIQLKVDTYSGNNIVSTELYQRKQDVRALRDETDARAAKDLNKQNTTIERDIATVEAVAASTRLAAYKENNYKNPFFEKKLFDAWVGAEMQVIVFDALAQNYKPNGPVPSQLGSLKKALQTFYKEFRLEIMEKDTKIKNVIVNPYFSPGSYTNVLERLENPDKAYVDFIHAYRGRKQSTVNEEYFKDLIKQYKSVLKSFDEYITKYGRQNNEHLQDRIKRGEELDELYSKHKGTKKIRAVFYPRESYKSPGNLTAIPIDLYYYKENNHWVLTELRSKQKPAVNRLIADKEKFPPGELFHQLNTSLRFPKGRLYWEIPSGQSLSIETTAEKRLSEWLTEIGLVVTVAAIGLSTAGAGLTVVAPLITIGIGLNVGGSIADIKEKSDQGILEQKDIALNVVNIVGSIAAGGAIAAGRLTATGAFRAGTAGRLAVFADRAFIPLTATAATADAISLLTFSADAYDQFQQLNKLPDSADKQAAMIRLLSLTMITGSIALLGLKGDIKEIGGNRSLVLDFDPISKRVFAKPQYEKFYEFTAVQQKAVEPLVDQALRTIKENGNTSLFTDLSRTKDAINELKNGKYFTTGNMVEFSSQEFLRKTLTKEKEIFLNAEIKCYDASNKAVGGNFREIDGLQFNKTTKSVEKAITIKLSQKKIYTEGIPADRNALKDFYNVPDSGQALKDFLSSKDFGFNSAQIQKIASAKIVYTELTTSKLVSIPPSNFKKYFASGIDFNKFEVKGISPETIGGTRDGMFEAILNEIRKKLK